MSFTKKNEEAVSPVIGVILMVAITVILAAVIAAFVFGMAGNIQKTHTVAATESRVNGTHVVVTYQGGQDAGSLIGVSFTVDGANVTPSISAGVIKLDGEEVVSNTLNSPLPVGSSMYLAAGNSGKNHIVGVGRFNDGSNQVIIDTTL
ncbi:MAG TPA: type IV pilin N-terminal domain-containing protein [Methanoregula sp.]|nr:type IV pilin N-terminal domain-containing protein [Methanoregula sp.]